MHNEANILTYLISVQIANNYFPNNFSFLYNT